MWWVWHISGQRIENKVPLLTQYISILSRCHRLTADCYNFAPLALSGSLTEIEWSVAAWRSVYLPVTLDLLEGIYLSSALSFFFSFRWLHTSRWERHRFQLLWQRIETLSFRFSRRENIKWTNSWEELMLTCDKQQLFMLEQRSENK